MLRVGGRYRHAAIVAIVALVLPAQAAAAPGTTGEFIRIPTRGPTPSDRSTPAVGAIGSEIFVFGGVKDDFQTKVNTFYDDLYRFDTRTAVWEQLRPSGPLPPPRAFAASVGDERARRVYVYGGAHYGPMFANFVAYDDLWAYARDANAWTQLQATNAGPSGRSRPNIWLIDETLYVFGGVTSTFETLNDLWAYDLPTNTWTLLHNGDEDAPPTRHEAQAGTYAHGGALTVYGGEQVDLAGGAFFSTLADTWELDLASGSWRDVTPPPPDDLQPPRNYGSTAIIGDSLYVHGGDVPGGSSGCGAPFPQNPNDEVWRRDLVANRWSKVSLSGTPVRLKRTNAAAVARTMYIFSGYDWKCDGPTDPGQVWSREVYAFRPTGAKDGGPASDTAAASASPEVPRHAASDSHGRGLPATGAEGCWAWAGVLALLGAAVMRTRPLRRAAGRRPR